MLFTKGYLKQGPRPHNVQPKGGTVIVPNSTSSLKTMDCSPPPKLFNLQNEKKKNPHLFSSFWLHLCGVRPDNIECDFSVT